MNIEDFDFENSHNEWSWIWNSIIILYTQVSVKEFQNGLCFDMYDTFLLEIFWIEDYVLRLSIGLNAFIESNLELIVDLGYDPVRVWNEWILVWNKNVVQWIMPCYSFYVWTDHSA